MEESEEEGKSGLREDTHLTVRFSRTQEEAARVSNVPLQIQSDFEFLTAEPTVPEMTDRSLQRKALWLALTMIFFLTHVRSGFRHWDDRNV